MRAIVGLAILSAALAAAPAAAVETYAVEYLLHEDPMDPDSPVVFAVSLKLSPDAVFGRQVGWRVSGIEFREIDAEGETLRAWYAGAPTVHTADGVWWIIHEDVEEPTASEFAVPPLIDGVAASTVNGEPSLTYSLEGSIYLPPIDGPQYPVTASLSTQFSSAGSAMLPDRNARPTRVRPADPEQD